MQEKKRATSRSPLRSRVRLPLRLERLEQAPFAAGAILLDAVAQAAHVLQQKIGERKKLHAVKQRILVMSGFKHRHVTTGAADLEENEFAGKRFAIPCSARRRREKRHEIGESFHRSAVILGIAIQV